MRVSLRVLVAVVGLAVLVSGCGRAAERVSERIAEEAIGRAVDGDVQIDQDGEEITVESDEGTFRMGSTSLPDEFPSQMPVPDGLQVVSSMSNAAEGRQAIVVQLQGEAGSFEELKAYFDERLAGGGWSLDGTNVMDMQGMRAAQFQVSGHGFTGMVQVQQLGETDDDELVSVVYTLESAQD